MQYDLWYPQLQRILRAEGLAQFIGTARPTNDEVFQLRSGDATRVTQMERKEQELWDRHNQKLYSCRLVA
eukprot:3206235-Prymnesium_polylepis.1